MNSTKPWILEKNGIRPAGKPDECFYCHCKIGEEHKPECVIRERTVVVKFEVDLAILVPEHWQKEDIQFRYNDSTWCANNLVTMLAAGAGMLGSELLFTTVLVCAGVLALFFDAYCD